MVRWVYFFILLGLVFSAAGCSTGISPVLAGKAQKAGPSTVILPVAALVEPTPTAIVPVTMHTREITEAYTDEKFTFQASYPLLEWASDTRVEPFNQAVENFIRSELEYFRQAAAQSAASGPETATGFLEIRYALVTSDYGILSFEFLVESYFFPAAHPGLRTHTMNYDMVAGKELSLDELFLPDAPYLDLLAQTSIRLLNERQEQIWEAGALPLAENYRAWNITQTGLRLLFDEYQVAPYATGRQEVTVPYQALLGMLAPQGRLEGFLNR